ncbi:MAG: Alpha/beta hydrolase family protein [candidate division WS6 bacterium OLB20]|uniref:Alpha/beta hydrolase family protein n=1 Tax=candidate division WS6 bacterium OLB20 TaxID=1617426 RepID=A0A136LWK5_9BACT|nr:MAG: Alpha/beta hydrolase family protein [candidate division WS6 bacterium OLB20]
MRNRRKTILTVSAFLMIGLIAVIVFIIARPYRADDGARSALAGDGKVVVNDFAGFIRFAPAETKDLTGIIIYPGGLVEAESYAPLAYELALDGYTTFIVRMPFNLAVLDPGKADQVIAANPQFDTWIVGGHSLGGAMAAQFADNNTEVDGLFLLAAYPPDSTDLRDEPYPAVSIYGSSDTVLNRDAVSKSNLPAENEIIVIEGGNHAQFGSYGAQAGDSPPSVSVTEQISRTVSAIETYLLAAPLQQ